MSVDEAAFMGKMSARMTHELRNILAILKESAGLITDILLLDEEGSIPHRDKMERALSRIRDQIPRGTELLDHFNKLAHSMDAPKAQLELSEFIQHVAVITKSFTRLKMVDLKTIPTKEPFYFSTDPFRLHWILFSCIEYSLGHVTEGSTLILTAIQSKTGPGVEIRPENFDREPSEMSPILPEELNHLQTPLSSINGQLHGDVQSNSGYLLLKLKA